MEIKCEICGGEVRPTKDLFNDPNFEDVCGREGLPPITEYNCIVCGQMYSKEGKKLKYKIGWAGGKHVIT